MTTPIYFGGHYKLLGSKAQVEQAAKLIQQQSLVPVEIHTLPDQKKYHQLAIITTTGDVEEYKRFKLFEEKEKTHGYPEELVTAENAIIKLLEKMPVWKNALQDMLYELGSIKREHFEKKNPEAKKWAQYEEDTLGEGEEIQVTPKLIADLKQGRTQIAEDGRLIAIA